MRRSGLAGLLAFVVIVVALVAGVLAAGWSPLLGLDLQGGIAVVLKPTTPADEEQLAQAVEVIRNRVDAIGVAEPDITIQGDNVVVQLPGVKDRERALQLVGSTAELRFRPVLQVFQNPAVLAEMMATSTTTAGVSGDRGATNTTATTGAGSSTTATTATTQPASATTEQGLAPVGAASGEYALAPVRRQAATTVPAETTTTAAGAAVPTTAPGTPAGDPTSTTVAVDPTQAAPDLSTIWPDVTPREEDLNENTVVLPQFEPGRGVEEFRYGLGPTMVTGDALVAEETRANLNPNTGEWFVEITFKDGEENVGAWRAAAAACYQASNPQICPTGRLGAVLDGLVISAPSVNDTFSTGNSAIISGQFTQEEARDLAQQLRYGALPVEFERQQSQDVSATIGKDALRAGIAAGLIGLAVVAVYILLYYRILGLVALASLALSFGLLWAIIAWLGESRGLALSLSGVVGIIVSIGVSIDSNIVYFEQIKDEMATRGNLRSSAQRAFGGAMNTIVKADLVSLIGAGLLYWLTVGPVKGFALFLGLSTLLDLVASYLFMKPAVQVLTRSDLALRRPTLFGMPKPREPHLAEAKA